MKLKIFLPALIIIMATAMCSCAEKKISTTEFAMNTVVTLTAYGDNADKAVSDAIKEVKRIEKLLSCHVANSEISKINSSAHIAPVEVSDETARVLSKALDMSRKTKGAFDISVKPLVDLWNITAENPEIPSDDDIAKVLDNVGYENISISDNFVSFKSEGTQIDLGGAAKGYCADRIAQIFKKHNIKNAIIDLGGNIYAMGNSEQGKPWRIGLQAPGKSRGEHFSVEELRDMSVVTSGSYERYFEKDGKIYHHILDPKHGKPADSGIISVSVVSASSFEADMLSTAIFVMGSEEFQKLSSEDFNYIKYITVDKNNMPRTYTNNN